MKLPLDLEKLRDELKPRDLHYRPECSEIGWKCGAHKSWEEGFDAGALATSTYMQVEVDKLVETLERAEKELKMACEDSTYLGFPLFIRTVLVNHRAWKEKQK